MKFNITLFYDLEIPPKIHIAQLESNFIFIY